MKTKHISALIRDDITTIAVRFFGAAGPDEESLTRIGKTSIKTMRQGEVLREPVYTFKCLKVDAQTLSENDMVVVDTRKGFAVGQLVQIHEQIEIDPDYEGDYRWFVCKIDLGRFNKIVEHEKELDKAVLASERAVKQKSIVDTFRQALGSGPLAERFAALSQGPALPPPAPARSFEEGGE